MSSSQTCRIALAQANPIVGDVSGNLALARDLRAQAARAQADIIVFSEMFLAGYPPEDLVKAPAFQIACLKACEDLMHDTRDNGPAIIIGLPYKTGEKLYNALAILDNGQRMAIRYKVDLPNYGVFDEKRVFDAGSLPDIVTLRGLRFGLPICEDIWQPHLVEHLSRQSPDCLIVANASPYWQDKHEERHTIAVLRAAHAKCPLIYVNQIGGQDELVFDGASFVIHPDGECPLRLPEFQPALVIANLEHTPEGWRCIPQTQPSVLTQNEATYSACMLGLRDYVNKNGFGSVVLGLSGGIDSALCAALAVDALGADRVRCIMLPSRYTSQTSLIDAKDCAERLGVDYQSASIEQATAGLTLALASLIDPVEGITAENLQSRTRGTILMAISNATGAMVITTGNKSEMAVGYATLYGDMNGGFNPIKDIYKTHVFELAELRNSWKPVDARGPDHPVISKSILQKAPSAELRDNQTDQDSLPPYPILDALLVEILENETPLATLMEKGFEAQTARRVMALVQGAEYKRRQSAPGVKITRRNFGRDRRYPIINRFREID